MRARPSHFWEEAGCSTIATDTLIGRHEGRVYTLDKAGFDKQLAGVIDLYEQFTLRRDGMRCDGGDCAWTTMMTR